MGVVHVPKSWYGTVLDLKTDSNTEAHVTKGLNRVSNVAVGARIENHVIGVMK